MKSKIILILLLLFCKILGFTQDTITKHSNIQISINISMPTDYNKKYVLPVTTVIDPVEPIGGYSIYNKLGGAILIEYLKPLRSKLFLKTGLDFTMISSNKTAKDNEIFILHEYYQYNQNHPTLKELYEADFYNIIGGISVGSEYLLTSKSTILLNIIPDLFYISFEKLLYFDGNKKNENRISTHNYLSAIRFKLGYSYQFCYRYKVFISSEFYSDDFITPYFGIGLKYNFKIR